MVGILIDSAACSLPHPTGIAFVGFRGDWSNLQLLGCSLDWDMVVARPEPISTWHSLATGVMKVKPRSRVWRLKKEEFFLPDNVVGSETVSCYWMGKEPENKADTKRRVNPRQNTTEVDFWSNCAWRLLYYWTFSVTWVYSFHLLFSIFSFGFSVTCN